MLLHVLAPLMDLGRAMPLPPTPPTDRTAERQAIAAYLDRLAASDMLKGVETVTEVAAEQPAEAILERAQTQRADLLILCSHGRTGIKRWALGSVAQKVARHSPVPVLILQENRGGLTSEPSQSSQGRPINAMVALDGSLLAESALVPAVQLRVALSAPFPGALHLVRVLPFSTAFEYGQGDAVAKARQQAVQDVQISLEKIQRQLLKENPDIYVMTSLATSLDPAETLISIAETGEGEGMRSIASTSDIITVATHGRSGPARWVLGSVTERILGAARLPLLIVRPPQASKQDQDARKASPGKGILGGPAFKTGRAGADANKLCAVQTDHLIHG